MNKNSDLKSLGHSRSISNSQWSKESKSEISVFVEKKGTLGNKWCKNFFYGKGQNLKMKRELMGCKNVSVTLEKVSIEPITISIDLTCPISKDTLKSPMKIWPNQKITRKILRSRSPRSPIITTPIDLTRET